jgi:hypothetical protein
MELLGIIELLEHQTFSGGSHTKKTITIQIV